MMASAQDDPRRAGIIWATNLHGSRPSPSPAIPVTYRKVGPDSADLIAEAMGVPSPPEFLSRFEAGSHCYTAWVGGRLASYGWVSFRVEYVGEFNLRLHLLPGEAYIWDCFTLPAYRRQGLYSALLAHILSDLETGPVCRVWIGADSDNLASQRGIERAGFRAAAEIVLARVLAMRLVWVQGRPGVPEAIVAEARRAFLDNRDSVWLRAIEMLRDTAQPTAASLSAAPRHDQQPVAGSPSSTDNSPAPRAPVP